MCVTKMTQHRNLRSLQQKTTCQYIHVSYIFQQGAAGTMQPYPVGKGVIPLLGLNRVDPLQ